VLFDRRIQRNTPSQFATRILRQGVVSCLKVFYKKCWIKQYNKGGRVLRTEVCINDPRDFGVRKGLSNLAYLGRIAYHAITRFLKAQAVALATALDRSTFERLVTPSVQDGKRIPALRFGTPRTMRVLEAVSCAGLAFKAFSNANLRTVLIDRLGSDAVTVTAARTAYELAKLRGKGLVRKVHGRNLYTLTDLGYRAALYCTKLHQRLLTPTLDTLDAAVRDTLAASPHQIDRALTRLNVDFDTLAHACGLQLAA
jgi:hypothetical protein